jgi:hypothetical protein
MILEIDSILPLVTILGAAFAPTIASIWAGHTANKNAEKAAIKASEVKHALENTSQVMNNKLDHIHHLVNSQLTDAVERLNVAMAEIEELKKILAERGFVKRENE